MTKYTEVRSAEDVTDEILEMVRGIESGWYAESRIDWLDVWDRLERMRLEDGSYPDLGSAADTPARKHIRRIINAERRAN